MVQYAELMLLSGIHSHYSPVDERIHPALSKAYKHDPLVTQFFPFVVHVEIDYLHK